MKWRDQKNAVDMLAAKARREAEEMTLHRDALRNWSVRNFGNTNALAWSFAAGTAWGLARRSGTSRSQLRRSAVAAANASLFAWRVVNSQT